MNERIKKALDKNVTEALGCTEPAAIAYAAALCAKHAGKPMQIKARLSANIIKNSLIVCIPNSGGRYGISLALSLGALFGDSDKKLESLSAVKPENVAFADKFIADGCVEVCLQEKSPPLFIEVEITSESGKKARVRIENSHTQITLIEVDGQILQSEKACCSAIAPADFNIEEIWDFVLAEKDLALADKIIKVNGAMAEEGKCRGYGLCTGATPKQKMADKLLGGLKQIVEYTVAGIDARMAGASLPVMSNSGSGNQGLIATLPVMAAATVLGVNKEKERRAILLSSLISIYIKSRHSALNAYCGAVIAGAGAAAGITFLAGGSLSQVKMSLQNSLGVSFGVLCDGAKETCSLKVANSTFCAVYSSYLALKMISPKVREGVIFTTAESTIEHIASLCEKTSESIDKALMDIMLEP